MNQATRKALRKQRIAGILSNEPRVGPQTVHFDIANACNTRCTTCWHHSPHLTEAARPSADWKRRTLPFETFESVLNDLVALGGLEAIILSGMGDPTLHPELCRMVEHAHRLGVAVTIITNLLRADVPRLLASDGELDLLTSICGVSEATWQAFHAHPRRDGWQALLAQLERLRDAGFRPKHVQVINNQNFHELSDMVRFAARWPVRRINFKLASLRRGTEAVALRSDERRRLADELVPEAMALAESLGVATDLPAFAAQVRAHADGDGTRTAPIEEVGCYMGFVYARVTVDQEVLYCCNTRVSVGWLRDGVTFGALWDGPRWQAWRNKLHARRYPAGCDQCGKFKQNVKWSERLRAVAQ